MAFVRLTVGAAQIVDWNGQPVYHTELLKLANWVGPGLIEGNILIILQSLVPGYLA